MMLPVPLYTRPRRFSLSDGASAQRFLADEGYVIYRDVLSPAECCSGMALLWDWLEALGTGIDRGRPETWCDERWPPSVSGAGILPYCGIGQSDAMWYVRTRPAVRRAFEQVWGTRELLVSYDGCCLFRPWADDPERRTNAGWYHVDQNPTRKPGFECVQGLVNLLPTSTATGSTVLLPRSHLEFPRLAERYADSPRMRSGEDFISLGADDPLIDAAAPPPLCAHLEPGDLLLWDSRTVHCSTPGVLDARAPPPPSNRLLRAVAFVCMTPRNRASEAVLRSRKEALMNGVTTTHWPHHYQPTHAYSSYEELGSVAGRGNATPTGGPRLRLTAPIARLVGYTEEEAVAFGP